MNNNLVPYKDLPDVRNSHYSNWRGSFSEENKILAPMLSQLVRKLPQY